MASAGQELMDQLYTILVGEAAQTFLEKGGNGPNGLVILPEVIAEVFGNNPPPCVANDILAVCRAAAPARN